MVKNIFVGAKVRILWSNGWPELAGEEGTVVGVAKGSGIYGISEWIVSPDCWGSEKAPRPGVGGGGHFAPSSGQLEPIIPEGAQPSEFSFTEMMDNLGVVVA